MSKTTLQRNALIAGVAVAAGAITYGIERFKARRAEGVTPSGKNSGELKTQSLAELYRVDPKKADKLLDTYFVGYAKAFPDPDEQMSKAEIKEAALESGHWDVSLFTDKTGNLVAGAHTNVLETRAGNIGVIEYLWTDDSHRQKGVGTRAHDQVVGKMQSQVGGQLAGIFMEVNDPRLMTAEQRKEDSVDPAARLRFWESLGYSALDAVYIQPPLSDDSGSVNHLMPAFKRLDGDTSAVSKSDYLSILQAYFETWVEGDVTQHPDYQTIEKSLRRNDTVPLTPMSAARQAISDVIGESAPVEQSDSAQREAVRRAAEAQGAYASRQGSDGLVAY